MTPLYIFIWMKPKTEGGNNTRREKTYVPARKKKKEKGQGHPMQTDKEERREASQIHLVLHRSRCVEEETGEGRNVAGTLI